VAFLRTLDRVGTVDAIVDVNPHRAGRFAPGLGMPISAPESLVQVKPDLVVIMNGIYRDEIGAKCRDLGLTAEMIALGDI
jgi:hypothetical protein